MTLSSQIEAEALKAYPVDPENDGFTEDGREVVKDMASKNREIYEEGMWAMVELIKSKMIQI
jgi:hypothetical protein